MNLSAHVSCAGLARMTVSPLSLSLSFFNAQSNKSSDSTHVKHRRVAAFVACYLFLFPTGPAIDWSDCLSDHRSVHCAFVW